MNNKINPDMIILARESRGMTQSGLAKELSVSQAKLSKLESGLLDNIPGDLIKKLSNVLSYPEKFFFGKEQLSGLGKSLFYHRRRKSLPARTLAQIEAEGNLFRIHVSRLLKSIDIKDNKFFAADIEEYDNNIEDIARAVRCTWLLPTGPIRNLTYAIENAGGIVIPCKFQTRLVDALSLWLPSLPPLFFINSDSPSDRVRFSLAHELGHIFMHSITNPNMEDEANKFAAEILMPKSEISHSLSNLTLKKLAELKLYWKVSMASLLKRAKDLNKITDRQSSYLWAQMSVAGYRKKEPVELDLPREHPKTLQQIINTYIDKLGYSVDDLCQLLNLHSCQFNSMYNSFSDKRRLFVVK